MNLGHGILPGTPIASVEALVAAVQEHGRGADYAPTPWADVAARSTMDELLARYDRPGPRYTSYPTAVEFHDGVNDAVYAESLARANTATGAPLSVYVHLPFCEERCAYCGCNVVITKHRGRGGALPGLPRSRDRHAGRAPAEPAPHLAAALGRRHADLLHAPRSWSACSRACRVTSRSRRTRRSASRSTRGSRRRSSSRRCGSTASTACRWACRTSRPRCSRPSIASRATSRPRRLVDHARALGFRSINIDLIYGLPYQTIDGLLAHARPGVDAAARARGGVLVRLRAVDEGAHEAPARGLAARARR